jgi:hypothetical protein
MQLFHNAWAAQIPPDVEQRLMSAMEARMRRNGPDSRRPRVGAG